MGVHAPCAHTKWRCITTAAFKSVSDSLPSRQSAASTLPPNSHGGLWQLLSPPEDGGCPAAGVLRTHDLRTPARPLPAPTPPQVQKLECLRSAAEKPDGIIEIVLCKKTHEHRKTVFKHMIGGKLNRRRWKNNSIRCYPRIWALKYKYVRRQSRLI